MWRGVPLARITVFGGSILGSPCWGKLRAVRVWEVYRKSLAVRANGLKRSGCELLGFDCFPVIVLQWVAGVLCSGFRPEGIPSQVLLRLGMVCVSVYVCIYVYIYIYIFGSHVISRPHLLGGSGKGSPCEASCSGFGVGGVRSCVLASVLPPPLIMVS